MPPTTAQPIVFYDADCGFCTASATRLRRLDASVRVEPIRADTLRSHGLDPARARDELPMLMPDGTVFWGADAFAAIFRRSRQPLRLLGHAMRWPGLRHAARAAYRWIARNRGRLPGGTASCSVAAQQAPK